MPPAHQLSIQRRCPQKQAVQLRVRNFPTCVCSWLFPPRFAPLPQTLGRTIRPELSILGHARYNTIYGSLWREDERFEINGENLGNRMRGVYRVPRCRTPAGARTLGSRPRQLERLLRREPEEGTLGTARGARQFPLLQGGA